MRPTGAALEQCTESKDDETDCLPTDHCQILLPHGEHNRHHSSTLRTLRRATRAADSPPIRPLRQEEIDALPCKCWYFYCYKDTDAPPPKNVLDPRKRRCPRDRIHGSTSV